MQEARYPTSISNLASKKEDKMFGNRQHIITILIFIFANTIYADGYFLKRGTLSSGGGYSSSQNFILKDAIGQPVVGEAQSAEYIEQVGFYSYFVTPLVGIEEQKEAFPMVFSLSQNFPNPVNTKTNIRFTVPKVCHVSINIYDIVGRTVKSLVDEEKEPGSHEISWNRTDNTGSKLASGIYFIVMDAKSFRITQKIVVVR
jgi:hypothetical protein